jgi:hypothetical protein
MNTQEFMKALFLETEGNEKLEEYKKGLPIGRDENGNILLAQKRDKTLTVRNTCATGAGRTDFIRRLIITLSCLYEKDQACFFVLSPKTEYGELLRLHSADVTVPYIRNKEDIDKAVETLKELMRMRELGTGHPRLFLVLDGLEELPDAKKNGELEEYRAIYELLMRKNGVELITGVDLGKSIFAGYPGAFLGIGNCLVTTREEGQADVTYVGDDSSLTLPVPMTYPCEPSVLDSIIFLNQVPSN